MNRTHNEPIIGIFDTIDGSWPRMQNQLEDAKLIHILEARENNVSGIAYKLFFVYKMLFKNVLMTTIQIIFDIFINIAFLYILKPY